MSIEQSSLFQTRKRRDSLLNTRSVEYPYQKNAILTPVHTIHKNSKTSWIVELNKKGKQSNFYKIKWEITMFWEMSKYSFLRTQKALIIKNINWTALKLTTFVAIKCAIKRVTRKSLIQSSERPPTNQPKDRQHHRRMDKRSGQTLYKRGRAQHHHSSEKRTLKLQ